MIQFDRIRACLFDLDGTLIDSEGVWIEAQLAYLQRFGIVVSREELEAIVIGHAWQDIFAEFDRRWIRGRATKLEMEAETTAFFYDFIKSHDIVIYSSLALLRQLYSQGRRIGIVTGSTRERVEQFVDSMGLRGIVDVMIAEGDFHRGKPAPDGYLAAIEALGIPVNECLAFEDSQAGVSSAKAAGLFCVGLQRKGKALNGADLVLNDLSEFEKIQWKRF